MSRPRVAVTGMGVKSPAGNTVADAFDGLLDGRSRAVTVAELAKRELAVQFACLVPEFDLGDYFNLRERRRLERSAQLAVAAAADAVADAGFATPPDPDRVGVSVGTGVGAMTPSVHLAVAHDADPAGLPVDTVLRVMPSSPAAWIALRFGYRGPCLTYATACASGATAIGEAALKIRSGELDVAIAGGADTPVAPMIVAAFARIGALSLRNDDPAAASRPFDAARDGFVMGEGAAFMILERWDRAQARGARIYGEIAGYGSNTDAYHIVAPMPDGAVAAECVRLALADAGLRPADIGHINAHGTATPHNDRAESAALARTFADAAPPVTAPKGVTGHLIGGAGAFEAVMALVSARRGLVPPVANLAAPDDDCPLDLVRGTPRAVPVAPVLSSSFGFGGHNAVLVLVPAA